MNSQVPVYLRWLAYLFFALTLAPIGLAVAEFTKARRAAYYAIRRAALGRGSRWLIVAVILPAIGVILLVVPPQLAEVLPPPSTPTLLPISTPTATTQPTDTAAPTVTPTRRATATPPEIPTATPTRRPTATPPPIPSPTPTVHPPDVALTPIPSALPAGEGAHIELLALASEADSEGQPVEPGKKFATGQHLVYLFFEHEGMDPGVPVTIAWYRDGELQDICSSTWLWDLVEGRVWGREGKATVSCQPIAGWERGSYEIRVFIGTRLQGIAQFVIE